MEAMERGVEARWLEGDRVPGMKTTKRETMRRREAIAGQRSRAEEKRRRERRVRAGGIEDEGRGW